MIIEAAISTYGATPPDEKSEFRLPQTLLKHLAPVVETHHLLFSRLHSHFVLISGRANNNRKISLRLPRFD